MINTDVSNGLLSIVFFSSGDGDPLSVLRVYGPANSSGIKVINGIENKAINEDAVIESDLIVLQRDYCRQLEDFERIFRLSKKLSKPIVYDLDDLLFELPEDHPDTINHYYSNVLLPMFQSVMEADLVTVSTRRLRDYLHKYNNNIEVFPNYLNDDLWNIQDPPKRMAENGRICIGFMGGSSHEPDYKMVLPAILEILRKYPEKIYLYFWGMKPPYELSQHPDVECEWHPPSSGKYSDFASTFYTQKADILIAPLVDNLFNSCKSGLKYLEYSAIGVPGVYSRVDPFVDMITHGEDGFLASNIEEWIDSLSRLIENPELRENLANKAQQRIRQKWLLSANSGKLKQIYLHLLKRKNQTKMTDPTLQRMIRSINGQVQELIKDKDENICSLAKIAEEKNQKLDGLENQIIQRDTSLQSLGDQFNESNRKIEELSREIAMGRQELLSLETQLIESDRKIEDLSRVVATDEQDELTLTSQIGEKDQEIEALNNRIIQSNILIGELETKLQVSQEEVVSYVMSTSWQITRPLRKLMKLIKGR